MSTKTLIRRIPSVAFIVTLVIGLFWTWFGIACSVNEFSSGQWSSGEAIIGALIEGGTFGLPFLIIAWILWKASKIGAGLLILAGLAFGTWMYIEWSDIHPVVLASFVGVPIGLGIYTLIREKFTPTPINQVHNVEEA